MHNKCISVKKDGEDSTISKITGDGMGKWKHNIYFIYMRETVND